MNKVLITVDRSCQLNLHCKCFDTDEGCHQEKVDLKAKKALHNLWSKGHSLHIKWFVHLSTFSELYTIIMCIGTVNYSQWVEQ